MEARFASIEIIEGFCTVVRDIQLDNQLGVSKRLPDEPHIARAVLHQKDTGCPG